MHPPGRRTIPTLLVPFALLLPLAPVRSQQLVADLSPPSTSVVSSVPTAIVDLGGIAVFVATTAHGRELWRSDGTPAGTYLLRDINPGSRAANPEQLTVVGNLVFFVATVAGMGTELWRTDGTTAGTFLLRDDAGSNSGAPLTLAAYGGWLYFDACDAATGCSELWRSDGTEAGTVLFADLVPGTGSATPRLLAAGAGRLFFTASTTATGRELWSTDGTVSGTRLVVDANPGAASSTFQTAIGSPQGIFFVGNDGSATGNELYLSDGTVAGTRRVADLWAGTASPGITALTAFGNGVLFAADDGTGGGTEPWFSDGTAAGTRRLGDLRPGAASSSPSAFTQLAAGLAVFAATTDATGTELYRTDGTAAGTTIVADIQAGTASSSPNSFAAMGGFALFAADPNSVTIGEELWRTDGTAAGTSLVADLYPGGNGVYARHSSPYGLAVVGNTVFFGATLASPGTELCSSDGTATGTHLVMDLYPAQGGSEPTMFRSTANGVVFGAANNLWRSDGTAAGTSGLGMTYPEFLVELGGLAYGHGGPIAGFGYELFVTDGTIAGTRLAVDVNPGSATSYISPMRVANGRLWFCGWDGTTGNDVFVSDGTPFGTRKLTSVLPSSPRASGFVAAGSGTVAFAGKDPQANTELWLSDGSVAGTQLVDLYPGATASSPYGFYPAGNVTWFVATTPTGRMLCVTDGTPQGTSEIARVSNGATQLVALANGVLVFVQNSLSGSSGPEPFRYDGATSGPVLIGELRPGAAHGGIADMTAIGNLAFFTGSDGVHGRELWVTDGYALAMVRDLYPGAADGVIAGTVSHLPGTNLAIFAGSDGADGLQVFVSDGTAAGTTQIGKIGLRAGIGAVELAEFTLVQGAVWFRGDDGLTGSEPWRIDLRGVVAATGTNGTGCAGTGGRVPVLDAAGQPRLGNAAFGFQLGNAPPSTFSAVLISAVPSNVLIGTCRLRLAQPILQLPGVLTGATGTAFTPLPIPAVPSYAGLRLYAQAFVVDPQGSLLGIGSLSNGLWALLGY